MFCFYSKCLSFEFCFISMLKSSTVGTLSNSGDQFSEMVGRPVFYLQHLPLLTKLMNKMITIYVINFRFPNIIILNSVYNK